MNKMKTILVFGNPLVEVDSLAINLIPKLKKEFPEINFLHVDPTESLEEFGSNLTIIDVIQGINKPLIITDINKLILPNAKSMHDFDLSYNLKLLMKFGKIKSIKILGLPMNMKENEAINWLREKIKELKY
jgi:Ni,Fe-hydrogenase maturation factor